MSDTSNSGPSDFDAVVNGLNNLGNTLTDRLRSATLDIQGTQKGSDDVRNIQYNALLAHSEANREQNILDHNDTRSHISGQMILHGVWMFLFAFLAALMVTFLVNEKSDQNANRVISAIKEATPKPVEVTLDQSPKMKVDVQKTNDQFSATVDGDTMLVTVNVAGDGRTQVYAKSQSGQEVNITSEPTAPKPTVVPVPYYQPRDYGRWMMCDIADELWKAKNLTGVGSRTASVFENACQSNR